jgi:putative CocE/NonD family hydrolase
MRDGIHLGAMVYRPKERARLPCILTMTPYSTDTYHERAWYFAQQDYNFALVDVRGRGDSEGDDPTHTSDGPDGYDTVEWLAQQPWCDGQVAMWGGSYAGQNQWLTLKESPPHLCTIVPAASCHQPVDYAFRGPCRHCHQIRWLLLTSNATTKWNLTFEQDFWIQKWTELYRQHIPFSQLDRLVCGKIDPRFQEWALHPPHDPYWDEVGLTPAQYRHIEIPILTIAGHYDDCQMGSLYTGRMHERYGSHEGVSQHFVLIGPWDHAGTRTPQQEVGGVQFDEACLLDLNRLHKEWYDWVMKGGPRPEILKERVSYYLMGSEKWRHADDLGSIADSSQRLYLNSTNGRANDVYCSGRLVESPPDQSQPDRYVYDPLDTRPADLEQEEIKDYLTDERVALNLYGNGLVYHSLPFEEAVEITGWVKFVAWLELDVPDTDFRVILSEVLPNGTHIKLTEDYGRARYREGIHQEKLVASGEIFRYEFNGFTFFSRLVSKGSRLRLLIKCPNTIYLQKNYNSGGVVENESAADARTAHVRLYHDSEHPSYVELPFVTPSHEG